MAGKYQRFWAGMAVRFGVCGGGFLVFGWNEIPLFSFFDDGCSSVMDGLN